MPMCITANTTDAAPVKNGIPQAGHPPAGKKKEKVAVRKKDSKVNFVHPWLACNLKGHSASVLGLDFSPNGKYLASCSEGTNICYLVVSVFLLCFIALPPQCEGVMFCQCNSLLHSLILWLTPMSLKCYEQTLLKYWDRISLGT